MAAEVYDSSSGWGGNCVGRLDSDGQFYGGRRLDDYMGRVELDGSVYTGTRGRDFVGRVDADGSIYTSNRGSDCIGRVDDDGTIYDGSAWRGNAIGRVQGGGRIMQMRAGAAALLLGVI